MKQYIYPDNLKGAPMLFLWRLKDLAKIGIGAFRSCNLLRTVNFRGSRDLWNMVEIASDNAPLSGAKIVFDAS